MKLSSKPKWARDGLRAGPFKAIPPPRNDLDIAGRRVKIR